MPRPETEQQVRGETHLFEVGSAPDAELRADPPGGRQHEDDDAGWVGRPSFDHWLKPPAGRRR
ncbi:hypothetical protein [Micromonospora noduli]|uniref:hypothetical protein n=1 Tax=Micromonospora noduli TaxID=709876 RepID=UPI0015EB678D|nr:hypothetical protein [Micromonospora noduli]